MEKKAISEPEQEVQEEEIPETYEPQEIQIPDTDWIEEAPWTSTVKEVEMQEKYISEPEQMSEEQQKEVSETFDQQQPIQEKHTEETIPAVYEPEEIQIPESDWSPISPFTTPSRGGDAEDVSRDLATETQPGIAEPLQIAMGNAQSLSLRRVGRSYGTRAVEGIGENAEEDEEDDVWENEDEMEEVESRSEEEEEEEEEEQEKKAKESVARVEYVAETYKTQEISVPSSRPEEQESLSSEPQALHDPLGEIST